MELTAKHFIVLALVLFALVAILRPEKLTSILESYKQGEELEQGGEETITTIEEEGAGRTEIIAISSVNLSLSCADALNETREMISPTFYLWREDATEPKTVSIASDGTGITTLSPSEKITWAAGKDGTYYWRKEPLTMGKSDTAKEIKLYTVAGSGGASVQVFDMSYNDLTQGCYDVSGTNKTLGSGEDVNLQLTFDVTGEYTAVRSPYICVAYNDSIVNDVSVTGLYEVDAPTRILPSLDQCFDTGLDYYTDSDARLSYDISVDIISGQDPFFSPTQVANETLGTGTGTFKANNIPIAEGSETVYSWNSTGDGVITLTRGAGAAGNYTINYCTGKVVVEEAIANPGDTNMTYTHLNSNSRIDWYVVDKDLYYKDGTEYFVNPIDNSNMGSTFEWNATTRFK